MKKTLLTVPVFLFLAGTVFSQHLTDSGRTRTLEPILIEGEKNQEDIDRLPPVKDTYIFSGKKNEVILLTKSPAGLTEKYGRQVFAKVPGVFVYDMDGTGNQMNISTRGLDAHRSWEFSIRKDGILTTSDTYGYPASHYNIPMEAVDHIELVRGTGSLQYGAQFGGMLNYVSKQPDSTKKFSFESINTAGLYSLLSTYNCISGTIGKFRYSVWFNVKYNNGYRKNSDSRYDSEGISLYYDVSKKLQFKIDYTHSNYLIHLAGPLTDSMFYADPQMSTRSRNYYNPNIHIPSLTMNWKITPSTHLRFTASAVLGVRNSVMYDKPANIADTINPVTLQYSNRQVDIDHFNSYTFELRLSQSYQLLKHKSTLVAGVQYMNNNLWRRQQGKGTTGSDFDLTLVDPAWGRNMRYQTNNLAIFAENLWQFTDNLSVTTGIRGEIGQTDMTGTLSYYPDSAFPTTISHMFPLFGAGIQYAFNSSMNLYAGWSQAYRPVIFKDIVPASLYEVTDKNLKDANGHNAEIGFRGQWKFLKWDVSFFHMLYNNRMGTLAQTDTAGNLLLYRTNIGNSMTNGVELFVEGDFKFGKKWMFSLFTSTSFMDARYLDATIKSGNTNVDISGNKVESVPDWISRNGITLSYAMISLSALYSYTSSSFADPLNTVTPSSSGAVGVVPAYHLLDMHLAVQLVKKVKLQLNVNNMLDQHYFTKRPQFYPGPGIWSSDGITFSTTVSVKI